MPSAYQNDANRWFVELMRADKIELKPDPWDAEMLRSVKAKWIREHVRDMLNTNRFSIEDIEGRPIPIKPGQHHPPEVRYAAVKEKPPGKKQGGPPMVEEEVLIRRTVPWTPEIGSTGRRHVAGIKFRDEMARVHALGAMATKHDLELALELAAEALSSGPST